ncbi:MAG: hypothetical protein M3380_07360, partial [Chloroflexota bacterium]|nr:hypothetical protein [Chloroflexota bacterium]
AGAAPLAALLSGAVAVHGRHVLLVLSGGNIDIKRIGRILYHGLLSDDMLGLLALTRSEPPAPSASSQGQVE